MLLMVQVVEEVLFRERDEFNKFDCKLIDCELDAFERHRRGQEVEELVRLALLKAVKLLIFD